MSEDFPRNTLVKEREVQCAQLERYVMSFTGVAHAFAQHRPDGYLLVWAIVADQMQISDADTLAARIRQAEPVPKPYLQPPEMPLGGNFEARVVQASKFNRAIRAVLSQNKELGDELKRLHAVAPDLEGAERALAAIVNDPEPSDPIDIDPTRWSSAGFKPNVFMQPNRKP